MKRENIKIREIIMYIAIGVLVAMIIGQQFSIINLKQENQSKIDLITDTIKKNQKINNEKWIEIDESIKHNTEKINDNTNQIKMNNEKINNNLTRLLSNTNTMKELTNKQIDLFNDMENLANEIREANNYHKHILEQISDMLGIDF